MRQRKLLRRWLPSWPLADEAPIELRLTPLMNRKGDCSDMEQGKAMQIAPYNINGINGHLETLLDWLDDTQPDIVCLQEGKLFGKPPSALPAAMRRLFTGG